MYIIERGSCMIGILLGVNVLIATSVILATAMILNYFKVIEKGTNLYLNQKAYAPFRQIKFIKDLLERYKMLQLQGATIDLENMIKVYLYKQKIGKFKYLMVQSIAGKGKYMMWGILSLQIIIEVLGEHPGTSNLQFIFIVTSAMQCLFVTLSHVVINIEDKREECVLKLRDYILHTYPMKKKNLEKQEVKIFMEALDVEIDEQLLRQEEKTEMYELNEEDIRHLIQQFDKNA